jgi:hypothetical protein
MSTVQKITHFVVFFKTKFDVGSEILPPKKENSALVSQVLPLPKAGTRVYLVDTECK